LGGGILTQLTIPYDADMFVKSAQKTLPASAEVQQGLIQLKQLFLQKYSAYGASGAIMGILAAFAYLFPNTELFVMFIPIPLKAKYVVPVFILIDLFGGLHRIEGDNIGHFAHLGGAIVGLVLVLYWNKTNRKTFY
jgi:membrane associated rhomboid family serine protease